MNKKSSKRFKKIMQSYKNKEIVNIEDAINNVKKNCTTKFDESIDVAFCLNLKKKKVNYYQMSQISNQLPLGTYPKFVMMPRCREVKKK